MFYFGFLPKHFGLTITVKAPKKQTTERKSKNIWTRQLKERKKDGAYIIKQFRWLA